MNTELWLKLNDIKSIEDLCHSADFQKALTDKGWEVNWDELARLRHDIEQQLIRDME